jgi:GNAT superfamily N-acetyltransferase
VPVESACHGTRDLPSPVHFDSYVVLQRRLTGVVKPYRTRLRVTLSLLSRTDLHLLEHQLGYDKVELADADSWLGQGDRCFLGYIDGRASTRVWLNLRERTLPGNVKLRLGQGRVFIFNGFTLPLMRGYGLFPAVLTAALAWAEENGCEIAYADLRSRNTSSRRAFEKCGFEPLGSFRVVRVLRWERSLLPLRLRRIIADPA